MKRTRMKNRKLLDSYHTTRCWVCGHYGCDPAHVKSRGARGDDIPENIMSLCRDHHNEQGRIGILSFLKKYPEVWKRLQSMGWEMNGCKLWHPKLVQCPS